ncbi:transposase [Roseomonas sp. 18066]|uniref:transposase n=1 Tax=Roseomonas sp. 18066 TaxID=2681412 RepID=UPI00135C5F3C|nr:transposase [Roseomonas sp. 18066]
MTPSCGSACQARISAASTCAVANAEGRPLAFVLTPGTVADISVAASLLNGIAWPRRLLADKA